MVTLEPLPYEGAPGFSASMCHLCLARYCSPLPQCLQLGLEGKSSFSLSFAISEPHIVSTLTGAHSLLSEKMNYISYS